MEEEQVKTGIFSQFTKPFWIVNAFELFERGAYYATVAVLSLHVIFYIFKGNPLAPTIWGTLYAMLIILLYFIPIISAALADKYGYRKVLFACFGMMMFGYFSLSIVQPGQFWFLIFSFLMVGIGAGAFKPIISASIAHVTREEQRNLAYSIYYWMINLGATLVPLAVAIYTFYTYPGLADEIIAGKGFYSFVFVLSGILVIGNTLILFFFYKDPVEPQRDLSIGQALKRIAPAFRDKKFVVLLIIYSGFWFMFAYNHTFLGVNMVAFKRMPEWFVIPFLQTINPATIIILGPFLGKLVEKYKSLNIMMTGIVIFCIGLAINGFSNTPFLFILGIVVFSIGEFITHPGFIAYVSKIAPKDKITIYMGCIFLSTGLGNAVGGVVQGVLYNSIVWEMFRPKLFVAFIITIGLITLLCFMLYNRWISKEELKIDPMAEPETGIWTKPTTAFVVVLFIPFTIYGAYLGGTDMFYTQEEEVVYIPDWAEDYDQVPVELPTISEYSDENSEMEETITLSDEDVQNLIGLEFTLSWEDETPSDETRYRNEPDAFSFAVQVPDNDTALGSDVETAGMAHISYKIFPDGNYPEEDPYYDGTGEYIITVSCHDCGDQTLKRPNLGLLDIADTGNDWTLSIIYKYHLKKE